jgi:hypothetical protein
MRSPFSDHSVQSRRSLTPSSVLAGMPASKARALLLCNRSATARTISVRST